MSQKLEPVKVAYLGLDNAGKTSIIRFLEDKLSLRQVPIPTIKVRYTSRKYSLLGLEFYHWDFGGQKKFRKDYLARAEEYFANIRSLIYVIDVQAPERNIENLDYLKRVLTAIKKYSEGVNIYVFFHKFDSESFDEGLTKLSENSEELKKKILGLNIINDNLSFYNTSIYNNVGLLRAFSDIGVTLSGKPQLIQTLLNDYCKKTASSAAILFDRRLFIVDAKSVNENYTEVLERIGQAIVQGIESLEKFNIETYDVITKIKFPVPIIEDELGYVFFKRLDTTNPRLYLITLSKNPNTKALAERTLSILGEKLNELLE